ncbi:alpha/beta fold hydrolase [Vulcanibacillus modesticaldus]|nr:alpha/beta hydrolase family protein [Vulcanibacillus modesticaldus]
MLTERNLSHYSVGQYRYESEVNSSYKENNYITGKYYQNLAETDEKPVHVIFIHGWRMKNLTKIKKMFLKQFMEFGYNMYFFTLPYHFDRTPEISLYNGELMISANIERTLVAVKQAVQDLRSLIYWLKENYGGKVVLVGVSLGGYVANLTSIVEKEIDLLVSIMYANNLAHVIWNSTTGKYIKQELEKNRITFKQLNDHWRLITPSNFKPIIPLENILLINGKYDLYVTPEDSEHFWQAWGRPNRISYPSGHSGIVFNRSKIARDVIAFMKQKV